MLGSLFIGQSASRVVLRRRIPIAPPWDARSLDELAESMAYARGIHHPSLLAVLEATRSPEGLLSTTEYVEGVTLDVFLSRSRERGQRVPVRLALRVVEDLAHALTAAHELLSNRGHVKPLVGLHPECVILTSGDDALIGDLGIVALERVPADPRLRKYRAPELASGAASASAPVYGLGLLLWELLAGRESPPGTIPRLDQVASDVPPLVGELVMQSLSADPKKRFPDVAAFAKALVAAGHRRRPGELVRQLGELAGDLLDRQRNLLGSSEVAPTSWRPTMHALETLPPPPGPRQQKAIGLAAFRKPEPAAEGTAESSVQGAPSAAAVSAPRSLPIEVDVEIPSSPKLPQVREPQMTAPLLLVNKPQAAQDGVARAREPTPPTSPSTTGSTISFPPDDAFARPGRRWGLVLFVLLVLGGAAAFGVYAVREQLRAPEELALPAPLPSEAASGAGAAEPSPSGTATTARRPSSAPARGQPAQRPEEPAPPATDSAASAAPPPPASGEPAPAPPAAPAPAPAATAEETPPEELPENPYKPAPPPTPASDPGF